MDILSRNKKKNFGIIQRHLEKIIPTEFPTFSCPVQIGEQSVPYGDKGKIFVVDHPLRGLVLLFEIGPGVSYLKKNAKLPLFLSKLEIPAVIILLLRNATTVLLTKGGRVDDLNLEDLTWDLISTGMYAPSEVGSSISPPQIRQRHSKKTALKAKSEREKDETQKRIGSKQGKSMTADKNFLNRERLERIFASPHIEDAVFLAESTKLLSARLGQTGQHNERKLWVGIAKATLDLLPNASGQPTHFASAIEAISRAIVFLPPDEIVSAIKQLVDCALKTSTTIQDAEKLASVVLAILPSVDQKKVSTILRESLPKIRDRRNIPPSLVQVFTSVLRA